MKTEPAVLALADGSLFHGISIGAQGSSVGEVVFNTAMTGYQEILTDPSYCRQIVTLTYPHIGNTGITVDDNESSSVQAAGLVIRDLPLVASNWRSEQSLDTFLRAQGTVAIADIDTRKLTRHLRKHGAQAGCILTGPDLEASAAVTLAREFPGLQGMDLAQVVTCQEAYQWTKSSWSLAAANGESVAQNSAASPESYHVVAMDFGVKHNILRMLVDRGVRVTVVPAQTQASEVLALQPDGVFLSNGPGDPEPCDYAIQTISTLLESNIPLFGICLGHQLLALASGASTKKMKFGHHGANHPVLDQRTGKVMISSQNHGFAVDASSLGQHLKPTHVSLFDGSLQGIEHSEKPAFSFQGHPEASPGPHDVASLFDQFVEMIALSSGSRSEIAVPSTVPKSVNDTEQEA